MVTVGIVVALIAVAGPYTFQYLQQRGARNAADQLAMDLQRAKLLAIQRNSNCTLTINAPAVNQYTISLTGEVVDLRSYAGGVTFTNIPTPSVPSVTFNPQGVCTISGSFFLTGQNQLYRVRTTAAGGVSVKYFSGGKWI